MNPTSNSFMYPSLQLFTVHAISYKLESFNSLLSIMLYCGFWVLSHCPPKPRSKFDLAAHSALP